MRLLPLFVFFLLSVTASAQDPVPKPTPITFTLPSGKVLQFESEEQKWKFLAGMERAQQVRVQNASHSDAALKLVRVPIEGRVVDVVDEGICVEATHGRLVLVTGYPGVAKVAEGDLCRFQAVDDGTMAVVRIQKTRHHLASYAYVSGQTAR